MNSPISVIQIGKYRKTYICQVGKFSTIERLVLVRGGLPETHIAQRTHN
jgi:hypothetical protein